MFLCNITIKTILLTENLILLTILLTNNLLIILYILYKITPKCVIVFVNNI